MSKGGATSNTSGVGSNQGLEEVVGVFSLSMTLVTARRLLFLASFAVALAVLGAVVPLWVAAWPTLLLTAAYLASWGAAFSVLFLPKTFIDNIDKKAVLITGCDSGFGLRLAHHLHKMGATVFAGVLDEQSEGSKELTKLAAEDSTRLTMIPLNVTSDDDVKRAVRVVSGKLGDKKLQAIVNNAGVSAVTEVEWCPVETYRQILEVNALGPIRVTKAFLPLLRGSDTSGRVVIVASLAGRYTFPGFTAYSMSKCAAVSFADGLRREMRKWSISVHTIEPTIYRTPITASEQVHGAMQRHWDRSPDNIKSMYGEAYFQEFKAKIAHQLKRAKPVSQISEVIDDMVDAIFGTEPQMRYVPNVAAYFRSQVITAMPMPVQDLLLCQVQPKTPPAAVIKRNTRRHMSGGERTVGRTLQRLGSVPAWFLRHNSNSGDDKSPTKEVFQFPDAKANVNIMQNGKPVLSNDTKNTTEILQTDESVFDDINISDETKENTTTEITQTVESVFDDTNFSLEKKQ